MANSRRFTGAMPISQMTWPASMTSGELVSAPHMMKRVIRGFVSRRAVAPTAVEKALDLFAQLHPGAP
jgi:hypothetical protein